MPTGPADPPVDEGGEFTAVVPRSELQMIARLITAQNQHIDQQNTNIDRLMAVVEHTPTRKENRALTALIVVVVVVAFGFLLRISGQGTAQRRYLIECTTPSTPRERHDCYEQAQARTADAVAQLQRSSTDQANQQLALMAALLGKEPPPPIPYPTVPPPTTTTTTARAGPNPQALR